MAVPHVGRDKNGSCYSETGCYQLFYLKDGAALESLRFVPIKNFNHTTDRLTEVDGKFSKQNMRDLVPEILEGLSSSAKDIISEDVRFPRRGLFILIDTKDFNSIASGLTNASKYSDKDDERDATLPAGSKALLAKTIDPSGPTNDRKTWAYNNASQQFNKTLQRMKDYTINKMHSFTRMSFEERYNLVWCCEDCCSPKKCVLECEDLFKGKNPKNGKKLPPEPEDPPNKPNERLNWFKELIYEHYGNYVEDWAINLDQITKLECWNNDDYTVLEDRFVKAAPDRSVFFLNSARNDDYRPYIIADFTNRDYVGDRLKCKKETDKDKGRNIENNKSKLMKVIDKELDSNIFNIVGIRVADPDDFENDCTGYKDAHLLNMENPDDIGNFGVVYVADKDDRKLLVHKFAFNLRKSSLKEIHSGECPDLKDML